MEKYLWIQEVKATCFERAIKPRRDGTGRLCTREFAYAVKFPDGSRDVIDEVEFIKNFHIITTPKHRIIFEINELNRRIYRLTEFVKSDDFQQMDSYDKTLLTSQLKYMELYRDILKTRNNRMTDTSYIEMDLL